MNTEIKFLTYVTMLGFPAAGAESDDDPGLGGYVPSSSAAATRR